MRISDWSSDGCSSDLLYQATHVPVGEDQKQHLKLCRDVAIKFNTDFGVELFTLPDPIIPKETARVMSLRDGSMKMSKSDPSDWTGISRPDDDTPMRQKIPKPKTDPHPRQPLPPAPEGRQTRKGPSLTSIPNSASLTPHPA